MEITDYHNALKSVQHTECLLLTILLCDKKDQNVCNDNQGVMDMSVRLLNYHA